MEALSKYRTKNTRKSQEVFDKGSELLKRNPDAAKSLGDEAWAFLEQLFLASIDIGRLDVADHTLQLLGDRFKKSPRVECLVGIRMEATESTQVVLDFYDDILEADSANAAIWKRKVSVLRRAGRIDHAVEDLSEYLDTFYNDVEAWLELADIYASVNQYHSSLLALQHTLLLNPQNPFYVLQAAETAYTDNDVPLALKYFLLVVEMTGGDEKPEGIEVRAWYGVKLCTGRLTTSLRIYSTSASDTAVPAVKPLAMLVALAAEQLRKAYPQAATGVTADWLRS